MNQPTNERRFDLGGWLTLAVAILLILWPLALSIQFASYPTDGWARFVQDSGFSRSGPFRYQFPLSSMAAALQKDDVVVAIDGRELVAGELPPLPAPWRVGQTVRYTVERAGDVLDVDLELTQVGLAGYLTFLARSPWVFSVASLTLFLVAALVFFIRPRSDAAKYLLIAGAFVVGTTLDLTQSNIGFYAQPAPLINLANVFMTGWIWAFAASLILFVLVFPIPLWPLKRFPKALPVVLYCFALGAMVVATPRYPTLAQSAVQGTVGGLTSLGLFGAVLVAVAGSVFYNLRGSRDPVARAQFRWLAFGLVVGLGPIFIVATVTSLPQLDEWDFAVNANELATLLSVALPISLAIGILRYHLFDIDVIIRRTTSYAILTGLLLLVYFGSIVVLQRLFAPITGESTIAVVLSTLLIAALFLPLRRRVQSVIDRRFFRKKYDAEQVLAQFAATVRDETDLDELTAELVRVIQETMQPEFVSVWLNPDASPTAEPKERTHVR